MPSSGIRYGKSPGSRAESSTLRREEGGCAGPNGFCPRRRRSPPRGFRGPRGPRAWQCDPVGKSRSSGSPGHSRQLPDCPAQGAQLRPSAILGVGPEEFCTISSGVPAGECRGALRAAALGSGGPLSNRELRVLEVLGPGPSAPGTPRGGHLVLPLGFLRALVGCRTRVKSPAESTHEGTARSPLPMCTLRTTHPPQPHSAPCPLGQWLPALWLSPSLETWKLALSETISAWWQYGSINAD